MMPPTSHPTSAHSDYDIVICGAGFTGSTLALGLIKAMHQNKLPPLRIALIEKKALYLNAEPTARAALPESTTAPTGRAIALSYSSYLIYQHMGLGPDLQPYTTPIHEVHVSEHKRFGVTRLNADHWQLPALGYVISGNYLQSCLTRALKRLQQQAAADTSPSSPSVTIISPAAIKAISTPQDTQAPTEITLQLTDDNTGKQSTQILRTQLLVGADGAHSTVRHCLGLTIESSRPPSEKSTAIITTITTSEPITTHNTAYERFMPQGPMALLPVQSSDEHCRYTFVWVVPPDQSKLLLTLDDADFLKTAQSYWGYRVGKWLQASPRIPILLDTVKTQNPLKGNTVLLGNASQTLHPVAAQGFNLGLRDIKRLIDALTESLADNNWSTSTCQQALQQYITHRQQDQTQITRLTQGLTTFFGYESKALSRCRGLGLALLDLSPYTKTRIFKPLLGYLST